MWFRRLLIPFYTAACVGWLLGSAALFLPVFWLLRIRRKWLFGLYNLQSRAIYAGLRPALLRLSVVRKGNNFDPRPAIFVANHQSVLDPFVFWKLGLGPVVFATKGWPFRLPFYGPFLRGMGFINTEENRLDEVCEKVRRQLESGVSVVFFPEGSRRTVPGRFHSLPFHVALRLQTAVVPVCIDGHDRLLPPKRYLPQTGTATYTILPALRPADFQGEDGALRLAQKAKRAIAGELAGNAAFLG